MVSPFAAIGLLTKPRVVERIFRDATGKSAKTIAVALNKDEIPAPSSGE